MKEGKQKTSDGCHAEVGTEARGKHGVQTCMGMVENNLVEVPIVEGDLLTQIVSPSNMNLAYKRVVGNAGSGGIDGMEVKELLPYLRSHKEELVKKLMDGKYRPNPVRRVEIPKDNGKKRPLGIPTVVDRLVQQCMAQVLQPLYEPQFSPNSFGFRPNRGAHQALRCAQSIINDGNRFCIDLDLEQFFDNVSHSKLIEVIGRTVKDGRVVSLIHKYLNAGVMEELEESEDEDSQPHQVRNTQMAGMETRLDERLLACFQNVGHEPSDEQQQPIPSWLPLPNGLLRCGIVNEEPPYAEPHVRWCERTENKSRRKLLCFPPTRFGW